MYPVSYTHLGTVSIVKDLGASIEGKHVLIAEDILDSGLTLSFLVEELSRRSPASLEIATLLRKRGVQKNDLSCAYICLLYTSRCV